MGDPPADDARNRARDLEEGRRRFHDLMGIAVSSEDGKARAVLGRSAGVTNALGGVHGGAIASLLDVALTAAARSVAPEVSSVVTVNMSINYLSPGTSVLTAEARVLSAGARIASAAADVVAEDGTHVATALATLRLIRR